MSAGAERSKDTATGERTPSRPYAGLWERLQAAMVDHQLPPESDLREPAWPPLEWDLDLEHAFRKIRWKRRQAEGAADHARDAVDRAGRGWLGRPSTRQLQAVADADERYQRLLGLERQFLRYRPERLFLKRALKRGPVPARRPSALDADPISPW